jgi:hypothetical protein
MAKNLRLQQGWVVIPPATVALLAVCCYPSEVDKWGAAYITGPWTRNCCCRTIVNRKARGRPFCATAVDLEAARETIRAVRIERVSRRRCWLIRGYGPAGGSGRHGSRDKRPRCSRQFLCAQCDILMTALHAG